MAGLDSVLFSSCGTVRENDDGDNNDDEDDDDNDDEDDNGVEDEDEIIKVAFSVL